MDQLISLPRRHCLLINHSKIIYVSLEDITI